MLNVSVKITFTSFYPENIIYFPPNLGKLELFNVFFVNQWLYLSRFFTYIVFVVTLNYTELYRNSILIS